MAVKTDVLLLAESGDVTVARRTAFYTYGKFDVILPEGQEQEETDSRLTDGYLARAHDGNVGRFDFGFARADATVNIDAGTSDLETQIDSAELRSEGDVFFEGDIGPEGFNGFVPGVDFDTGDIVSVTRWGSRLSLPVTDIEYEVSDSGGPRASRVHVSGQLIHDAASRRRSNDEIRQQIAAEKRERLRQVGAVDQKATQAKDTAVQAKDTAGQAKQVAQTANSAATQAQRSADGKSTIFYGATTPTGAKAGDTWFKDVAGGGTVLMQYVNGKWVEKVNTKAIDDELAANQAALTELNEVALPALRQELEALDALTAGEVADKLATLETKLANADRALKQELQGELAALDTALSGDLATSLASLKDELEALDADVASEAADKLAALETKLTNADKALKQGLQGELNALDTALSRELTTSLAGLKEELEAADEAAANEVASTMEELDRNLRENAVSEVTANQLWANGIAAKSVITNRILVAGNGNMLPEIATYATASSKPEPDPYPRPFGLNASAQSLWVQGSSGTVIHHPVELVAGQKYRFSYRVNASVDGTRHYWQLRKGTADGYPGYSSGSVPAKVGSSTTSNVIANAVANKAVISHEVEFEALTTETVYFYLYPNHSNGAANPDGYQWFRDLRLEKMTGATLIEDGAITTDKIAADAVTANAIKADAVTANAIKAGEVAAKHLAADSVSATKLLAEDATIDKLWANGIAAKSITASKLTVSPGNLIPEADSFGNPDAELVVWENFGRNAAMGAVFLRGSIAQIASVGIKAQAGDRFRLTMDVRADTLNSTLYFRMWDTDGVKGIPITDLDSNRTASAGAGDAFRDAPPTVNTWHKYEASFTIPEDVTLDFRIYANWGLSGSPTTLIRNLRMQRMTGATLIEDGAVTTDKIAADAVTANKIKADQVLAKHVKTDQILAKHVKAGEIKSTHLLAEEATINKLWTNGLAAKSITASRLTVSPGNVFPDPHFQDPSWGSLRSGDGISLTATGTQNGVYLQPEGQLDASMQRIPGVNYLMTAHLRFGGTGGITRFSIYARYKNLDGATKTTKVGEFPRFPTDGQEHASYRYRDNSAIMDLSSLDMAAGGYFTLGFYVESSMPDGSVSISNVRLTPMSGTTLIENGAITTDKIAADAVTANSIKSGQITSDHISSAKISSDKITVKNGFIQNAMIGDGQVNNAKIANLDASKITAGTINANRIGAKTIEGRHLAVDTIEANQIKANVFTQVASSAIPLYPGTTRPAWTMNADATGVNSNIKDGDQRWYRFGSTKQPGSDNLVEVDPDIEYVFSTWIHGTTNSVIYLELRDQDGNHAVASGGISGYNSNNASNYLIQNFTITSGWKKISTKIKLKPEVRFVRIGGIYGNHSNGVNGDVYLADMRLYPDVASQAEVDERQDEAIKKMQDYVTELTQIFFSQSAAYAKKFNELSEPMSGGLRAGEDEDGVMTTTTSSITCTPGWVGHILVHYVSPSAGGIDTPGLSVARHEVTGSNRTFSIPSGRTSRSGSAAIHWFKRAGRPYTTDMSTGAQSATYNTWKTLSETSVGTGDWNLTATVGWDAATHHNKYGIRILVNGSEVARVAPRDGLGPLLPLGDGYRTQSLTASGNGNGRTTKFEIQAYTDATTSASGPRRIRRVNATLDWTKIN